MSASGLLYGGIAALVVAVFALVAAVMPRRQGKPGVARALATIDRRYARDIRTGGRTGGGADLFKLPGWLPDMATKLSPPAPAIPCSAGWTLRATQSAGRRTASWRARHSDWSYSARLEL